MVSSSEGASRGPASSQTSLRIAKSARVHACVLVTLVHNCASWCIIVIFCLCFATMLQFRGNARWPEQFATISKFRGNIRRPELMLCYWSMSPECNTIMPAHLNHRIVTFCSNIRISRERSTARINTLPLVEVLGIHYNNTRPPEPPTCYTLP